MKILAVDTATRSCSVAIADGEALLAETTLDSSETHSRHLVRLIETLVGDSGLCLDRIEAFAVARGPGSFTGLRIGIGTVKGLAVAGGCPVVGVSTLAALAWQVGPTDHAICPIIDARRSEVYAATFRWDANGPVPTDAERVTTIDSLLATLALPAVFIGNGAAAYRRQIAEKAGHLALFAAAGLNTGRAAAIAALAARRLSAGEADDVETLVPTYLRKSDAELKMAAIESACGKR